MPKPSRRLKILKFDHTNLHVSDLDRSLKFYREVVGLTEITRLETPSFIFVYLGDIYRSDHVLELQWVKNRTEPYDTSEGSFHLAFITDNFKASFEKHKKMGCVFKDHTKYGIYWLQDPDGYLIEILAETWEMGH